MADDDDDDEDLWADFDNDDDEVQVMLSANLCTVAGVEEHTVHEGDVDEGKVMWEAPSFAGLSNSQAVDSGVHCDYALPLLGELSYVVKWQSSCKLRFQKGGMCEVEEVKS
ncbi:MAG: hypothetical protein SGPRY_000657 [Prymnesium sp.]